jgi:cytoskeletal protein RodZ
MPPTLGQRLKHAREKRGLTLRDVEHVTRISVARLQDLEDDRLNTFGGLTYAKSFLRAYATMLDVSAEEVLNQLKPPPLGGVRDYRYLVESQGPWISQRRERQHQSHAPSGPVGPPKPFAYAVGLSLVFALVIGGGVLASGFFQAKPALTTPKTDEEPAMEYTVRPAQAADAHDHSREPFSSGDSLSPQEEFTLLGVSLTMMPDKPGADAPSAAPPKAQPVPESATPAPSVPKAIPVR